MLLEFRFMLLLRLLAMDEKCILNLLAMDLRHVMSTLSTLNDDGNDCVVFPRNEFISIHTFFLSPHTDLNLAS